MSRSLKQIAKHFGVLVVLFFCSFSYSNAQTSTTPVVTNPTFYDDTYVSVPLQFGFPFYGRTFTNSWMHSNGVVSFLDPAAPIPNQPYNPGQWAYCCQGMDLVPNNPQLGPQFNYMIAPLWTDLYPVPSSTFRTEGTNTYQKYFWNNIAEISNMNNLNTFSLEIRPTGYIGAIYNQINIQNQQVAAGITGDISLGQMQKFYFGIGIPSGALQNWSVNNTPGDQCATNPLSSPTCPGYTEAMCTTNPLYSSSCSGYQQAYFTQQCSINPLYNVACPGYASAYFNLQCSLDPLYATQCPGYDQAYFDKMCRENGLYSTQCPNYGSAYATWLALNQTTSSSSTTTTTTTVSTTTTTQPSTTISSDGTISTTVSKTGDSNVDKAITTTTTTTNSAAAPAAPVQLTQPSGQQVTTAVVVQEKKEEKKDATTTSASSGSSSSPTPSASTASGSKDQPKTARQELQERREAAAKAKAVEDGKNLAENVGKAVDMEQQKMVQNVVVQAMAFVPGFDSYNKVILIDKPFYPPVEVYKGQVNVDNKILGKRMFGPSDQLHNEMVNQQYK